MKSLVCCILLVLVCASLTLGASIELGDDPTQGSSGGGGGRVKREACVPNTRSSVWYSCRHFYVCVYPLLRDQFMICGDGAPYFNSDTGLCSSDSSVCGLRWRWH